MLEVATHIVPMAAAGWAFLVWLCGGGFGMALVVFVVLKMLGKQGASPVFDSVPPAHILFGDDARGCAVMLGFGKKDQPVGPGVSTKLCTRKFNGKYPHVGIYDCREHATWVCKSLSGQAIRTSHARLITGSDNATSTAWKDRFLCFWFYTPNTGQGYIHGYPIEWDEAHLLVRIDPNWDYDRQRLIPTELEDQVNANLERQFKHGERIVSFFAGCKLAYPFSLHFIGQRAADSSFYAKRVEGKK